MAAVTINTLRNAKEAGAPFAVSTAYDACFARALADAGVAALLVGDSLGNVLQGNDSTLPVTMADMVYHTRCVKAARTDSLLIADLPFMSVATPEEALANAGALMRAGAQMVKLEGGDWLCPTIERLRQCGVPVCAHLGLMPQNVNALGGFRVQGRSTTDAERMVADARALADAGADLLVLECVPRELARTITKSIGIPTIGIGAGPATDGQVLVMHDLLGLTPNPPRFVRNFMDGSRSIHDAFASFVTDVGSGRFPADEHCFD